MLSIVSPAPASRPILPALSSAALPSIVSPVPTSKPTLPPLSSTTLPSIVSPAPASKLTLPALSKVESLKLSALPSLSKSTLPLPSLSSLATAVKETRNEQVEKIAEEAKKAEEKQLPAISVAKLPELKSVSLPPLSSTKLPELKSVALPPLSSTKLPELKSVSLPPLSAAQLPPLQTTPLPVLSTKLPALKSSLPKSPVAISKSPSLKSPDMELNMPALKIAQEGVKTAKGAEPEAVFQGNLATIASPANLPSKKSKSTTPKIRIPKIISSSVKPSPKKSKAKGKEEIVLPADSTVIPPIPITSPEAMKIPKNVGVQEDDLMKVINSIDISKLKIDRVKDKDAGYSVTDLKVLAGALNLTKSGNKKDIVDRIKGLILKHKPNAFD